MYRSAGQDDTGGQLRVETKILNGTLGSRRSAGGTVGDETVDGSQKAKD